MKKVLIIRTGAIGDVVETTVLIRALKKIGWSIDYLTGQAPSGLLQYDEDINHLYILEKKNYSYIFKLAAQLKKEKYDLILNLQPSVRFKTLAFLTRAKKTVNYKKSYKFHAVENFFDTGKRAIPTLEAEKNLKLYIPDDIKRKMENKLAPKTRICFNTGANSSRQGRKWCIEYWIELGKLILAKYDAEIFLVGSNEDNINSEKLKKEIPQIKSFVGKTSLIETAALLSCADIVISGDTGPIHIASATNTTCLGLYGCCSISRSAPFGEKHKTITSTINCSPCDGRRCKLINSDIDDTPCMKDIKPEKVMNLIDILINEK